jgi:hypothetical protein
MAAAVGARKMQIRGLRFPDRAARQRLQRLHKLRELIALVEHYKRRLTRLFNRNEIKSAAALEAPGLAAVDVSDGEHAT